MENRPTEDTVYVSDSGQRIYVESVFGEPDDDFYLVNIVPEQDKDDMDAMGDELDSSQWVNMITTLGLKPESDTKTTEIERLRSMFKK
ncbi:MULTISPECIES: hypothetical protein [unclassified Vibrio]|uniref:hypothetical protein n=1 Tax=unclassified Vibrio TaxID=2614977 RepID=UPI001F27FAFC|nr:MULTISPECIES: hypothetical protein [unclassified Vibrio]MCF7456205.1 hypothetical protein [Vibrio sp. A1-1]MDW1968006.1 hypothetical protein [Vibrio sp. Vb0587]